MLKKKNRTNKHVISVSIRLYNFNLDSKHYNLVVHINFQAIIGPIHDVILRKTLSFYYTKQSRGTVTFDVIDFVFCVVFCVNIFTNSVCVKWMLVSNWMEMLCVWKVLSVLPKARSILPNMKSSGFDKVISTWEVK